MLGTREPAIYGNATLDDIYRDLSKLGEELKISLDYFQSNHEGELVEAIQQAPGKGFVGSIINLGAYTHTSIALRDALAASGLKFIEVHISNIYKRESFRHHSYISDLASGLVVGFGIVGYELALRGLAEQIK
jgi:3-dehydroquinate dehydratase-2